MKAYDTYIFDLDGTITDTMTVWLDILRDALLHFGMIPPDDKTLAWYSHDWRQLTQIGFPEDKLDEFAKFIYGLANTRLPQAEFHTGAYKTLEKLKNQGKKIGVFSSMDREMFEPAMQQRNLYPLAQVAIAGNEPTHRKPHPAGIEKAIEILGISSAARKSVVYVGDKDTDIQTAQNAGVASILYFPVSHNYIYDLEELKKYKPTHIITRWEELLV